MKRRSAEGNQISEHATFYFGFWGEFTAKRIPKVNIIPIKIVLVIPLLAPFQITGNRKCDDLTKVRIKMITNTLDQWFQTPVLKGQSPGTCRCVPCPMQYN